MAKLIEWIEFEVCNWEKFNPRNDRKGHTWFRLENTIAVEPKFFGLSAIQRYVAICLFAECSKNRGLGVRLNVSWFSDLLTVKQEIIRQTIQALVSGGVLRLPSGDDRLPTVGYVRTYERTNDTNDTNVRDKAPLDFEAVWQSYPRRLNKTEARARFQRLIHSAEEFEALNRAVAAYSRYVKTQATEEKFIKHFSSFLGTEEKQPWRDWIAPEAETLGETPEQRSERIKKQLRAEEETLLAAMRAEASHQDPGGAA